MPLPIRITARALPPSWLAAGLVLLTGGLAAQQPPAGSDAPPAVRDQVVQDQVARDQSVAERVLRLADGGAVRGTTRRVDGVWEVLGDDGWQPLPDGLVLDARREDELKREANKRRAAARRGDLDARCDVATWMLDSGLLTEAFRQLEEVLDEDPDHAGARSQLRRPDVRVALPSVSRRADERAASLAVLLDFAAGAPAPLRELLVDRLDAGTVDSEQREQLRELLLTELRHPRPGHRAFAALTLRRLYPDEPDVELLRRALLDPTSEVRTSASLAVRDADDPEWISTCIASLGHDSSTVRLHAAEALGTMLEPAAVAPLVAQYAALSKAGKGGGNTPRAAAFFGTQRAYVQGYNAQVANQAAIADPIIGTLQEGATIDARVLAAGGGSGLAGEREAVRGALERITGASPGRNASSWQRWWQQNGDEWQAQHLPPAEPGPPPAPPADRTTPEAW